MGVKTIGLCRDCGRNSSDLDSEDFCPDCVESPGQYKKDQKLVSLIRSILRKGINALFDRTFSR